MPSRSRQVRRAEARRAQGRKATGSVQGGGGDSGGGRAPGSSADKLPRISKTWWLIGGAAVVAVVVLAVVLGSGGGGGSAETALLTGSGYPNGDTFNTRYGTGPIDAANVSQLQPTWTVPLTAKSQYGSYSSSPIISGGAIFSQDLASNVQAINLKTGKVIWTKSYESPDQGPNGLVVAQGEVFGATATSAFALEEKTGRQLWSVTLTRNEHEGIDMSPGYHGGVVYVSTVPGNNEKFYGAGGVGILWALEASTGRKLWHFATAPEELWGSESVNAGGGVWYSPAFDEEGNMYIGTANPAPFPGTEQSPWGSSRPGPNLYTDAIVKLNAKTGKVEWHYQQTPHDLYDWDLQDPPILMSAGGRKEVVAAGKSGWVIALDPANGKVLWKRSVGTHNGHDSDGLYAMRHEYSKLSLPETVYPGLLGGVIAPMSTNGTLIFVPVVNHPVTFNNQTEPQENGPMSGELVALDAATGAVRWKHAFPTAAFGATSAVNDVVFTTTFDGTLYAFDANTGAVAWETKLPASTNTGVAVSGDTLIAPAGLATGAGQTPEIAAYKLP